MIKIISGTVGVRGKNGTVALKTPKDAPFSLTAAEEKRLVLRGAAAFTSGSGTKAAPKTGNETPTVIPAYSAEDKPAKLRELMKDAGLPIQVGMTKAEMAAALDAFYGVETTPAGETTPSASLTPLHGGELPAADDADDAEESGDNGDDADADDDDGETPPELGAEEPVT